MNEILGLWTLLGAMVFAYSPGITNNKWYIVLGGPLVWVMAAILWVMEIMDND